LLGGQFESFRDATSDLIEVPQLEAAAVRGRDSSRLVMAELRLRPPARYLTLVAGTN
jgi:hypothetical protein